MRIVSFTVSVEIIEEDFATQEQFEEVLEAMEEIVGKRGWSLNDSEIIDEE